MSKTVSIISREGTAFDAYLALPPSGPAPAIVVVPSVFGVTDALKSSIDRYASKGFIVIAPDPFWRTHPGPLAGSEMEAAQKRKNAYDDESGLDDLQRTIDLLKTMPEWNGKFGIFGFCFGGKHAILGFTRLGAQAGASFHGTQMHTVLDEAAKIAGPFSFHFGADDHLIPIENVNALRKALDGKDGEIFVYDGAGHSFSLPDSKSYNPEVAKISEDRALAVFDQLKEHAVA